MKGGYRRTGSRLFEVVVVEEFRKDIVKGVHRTRLLKKKGASLEKLFSESAPYFFRKVLRTL